ncbi:DNA repair protein REV1 [Silene latifolia]|uniref:DNA repair protein REV1 n=1 Tax=Silene latifolia TaxID=37657 RepID=UPI003D781E50
MSQNSTRSANSNSKRSLNSYSSNNTNNNKKKKSNSNQKTLGAAWGSNSLSSSRSSFRSAPFSDFGSYMAVKNKKLHDQFDAVASDSSHNGSDPKKQIFQGIAIFVDGFTIPSSQELRGYMLRHGGRFENYFSRHRVTHIICSNLPDTKIKNLRSFSGGLPVVKPTWILDCVAASKLLSWIPYQLEQLASQARGQPKLSAFFASKGKSISRDVSSESSGLLKAKAGASESNGLLNDSNSCNDGELFESARQGEPEIKDGILNDFTTFNVDEVSECTRHAKTELENAGRRQIDTAFSLETTSEGDEYSHLENDMAVTGTDGCSIGAFGHLTSSGNIVSEEKATEESSGSLVGGPSHHRHSTIEDPNFVENYFKNSRLHFIGTWRNRYRKRFSSQPNKNMKAVPDVRSDSAQACIIHVDMDCFFVAVVIRNRKDLMDKPVAVCHSDSSRGTAEISSANYPARDYGVKAGMFVRDAKARCPHLLIIPYNFKAYEEVADQFYNILHQHCNKVQAVSCDEAFLDITDSEVKDPEILASVIRKEIFETTGCTASVGIAGNMLMARLATRAAKPDGQYYIPPEKVDEYLLPLPIKALPGIGRVLEEKLKKKGVQTCGQLQMYSKDSLRKEFGIKTGEMLWNYCRGVDNRLVDVIQESKSVGAEVNWGVRFKDKKNSEHFLLSLCKEVALRLQGCGVHGRTFTLKIKKRRKDAEEPAKYMGCGDCENLSHSVTVPAATDDVDVLQRITMQLFGTFHIDVKDIRGVGLQVTKLESADIVKQGLERSTLRSWLASGTTSHMEKSNSPNAGEVHPELDQPSPRLNAAGSLPSVDDLDLDVIENLPSDLFSELNGMYGGKLNDLIFKRKGTLGNQPASAILVNGVGGKSFDGQLEASNTVQINIQEKNGAGCSNSKETEAVSASGAETFILNPVLDSVNVDVMPSSLSQVDITILQQLPEDLRADIVGALPAHRMSNCSTEHNITAPIVELKLASTELAKSQNFWVGNPPYWVLEFKTSNCLMLNILAEMYLKSESELLSSTLQRCLSGLLLFGEVTEDLSDEASSSLCELLRQYIQLKLEIDIEEIYVCFRLLKRLAKKFKAFLDVYDTVLPGLQGCVSEIYGGNMHLPSGQ